MIQDQAAAGNISASTACLQNGLIYDLSDDEIVDDCLDAYQTEMREAANRSE